MRVKCIKTIMGWDDIGMSGLVYECTEFKEGDEYEVEKDGYVVSRTGCCFNYAMHKHEFEEIKE